MLDTLKQQLSPAILASCAQVLNEHEQDISKALNCIGPIFLAGLRDKSKDSAFITAAFTSIQQFDPAVLQNPQMLIENGNLAHGDPRDEFGALFGDLFAEKIPAIIHAIAAFSGVKLSSASALLGLAGPMAMGLLNQKIQAEQLEVDGFVQWLKDEEENIAALLPPNIAAVMGLLPAQVAASDSSPFGAAKTGQQWWRALLLLLGLGLLLLYLLK